MARLMNAERVEITSPYGKRTDPITGKATTHSGVDLVGRPRTSSNPEIYCHTAGTVSAASFSATWGYYVDIRLRDGSLMRYAHMLKGLKVKVGQSVKQGQVLGIMGSTGRANGVHLHFGLNKNNQWIDPTPYLEEDYLPMTIDEFMTMMLECLDDLAHRMPSSSAEAKAAHKWAEENGVVKGATGGDKEYRALVTKEDVVLMMSRYHNGGK